MFAKNPYGVARECWWLLRVARCGSTVSSDFSAPQNGSGSPLLPEN